MSNKIIQQYMELYNITEEEMKNIAYTEYMNTDDRFTDFDKFSDRLKSIVELQYGYTNITIVPDYDADGICSGLVAYYGLKLLGCRNVELYPPVTHYGYGLNPMTIHHVMNAHPDTDVILTTDNGINAKEAIDIAESLYDVEVIVTDHHEGRNDLFPDKASAVINPNRKDKKEIYPFKQVSGTVVIWKLLQSYMIENKYKPYELKDLNSMIYLVGISTISDVMPFEKENRDYIKGALNALNQIEVVIDLTLNEDIKQLHHIFKVFIRELQSQKFIYNKTLEDPDIGFVIAPILNSSRRILDSSEMPFSLFTLPVNTSYIDIKDRVDFLINLNVQRKEIIKEENSRIDYDKTKSCIVYQKYSVTHGIAGLVANEIMKQTEKPVIALSYDYSGSARSLNNLSLQDALSYIDEKDSNVILNWGGHALAAGLKVNPLYIDKFEELICEYFDQFDEDLSSQSHKYITLTNLSDPNLAEELTEANDEFDDLKPFSSKTPQPKFKLKFNLDDYNIMQMKNKHSKIKFNKNLEMIYWNGLEEINQAIIDDENYVEAVCRFQINEFNGFKTAQFIVSNIEFKEAE